VKVTKQVVVPFSIGKYVDEVLCDVVPMQASHFLLGRPWQYDRKANHDGVKNRYTIVKDGKIITLVPLTPKHVYDDQIKLNSEHEAMGRENQGEEQGERRPSDSARTQTTTTHSPTHPNTNKYSANTPNKSDHSTILCTRRLTLILMILIILCLVLLFLCYRSLMMCSPTTLLADYHH